MISSSVITSVVSSRLDTVTSACVHSNAMNTISKEIMSPISVNRSFLFSKFAFSVFLISISIVVFYIPILPGKVRKNNFYFKLFIHFVDLQKI